MVVPAPAKDLGILQAVVEISGGLSISSSCLCRFGAVPCAMGTPAFGALVVIVAARHVTVGFRYSSVCISHKIDWTSLKVWVMGFQGGVCDTSCPTF